MAERSQTKKRSVRRNADVPLIFCGPAAHIKRPARDAQPAPEWSCSKGFGGAALNKQNGRLAGRRGVHFRHDGTIMPCLPVSPSPVFPVPQPLLYYKSRSFTVRKILIKSQQKIKNQQQNRDTILSVWCQNYNNLL